jgi:Ca-activated chloride channel family protein
LKETVVAEPAPAPEPDPAPTPLPADPTFNFIPSVALTDGGEKLIDAGQAYEIYRANPDGSKGERITTEYNSYKGNLEPGDYVIRAALGQAAVEQPLKVETGKTYEPVYVLNAGELVIRPRSSPDADVDTGASVVIDHPGAEFPGTWYGETKIYLPAGEQRLTVKIGSGEVSETIQLAAGQTIEKDVVVGVGRAVVNALYAPGADKVENSGMFVRIAKAKKKIDGSREDVVNGYGPDQKFDLSPGDYVAIVKMDEAEAERPFTVQVGQLQDVTATLNAGVLAISAPGAKFIEVFDAKKNIDGSRKSRGNAYAETHQATLPAGDYTVSAERGDSGAKTEATAAVKAGERTEVTVP